MNRFDHISDEDLLQIENACAGFEQRIRRKSDVSIETILCDFPKRIQPVLFRELLAIEIEFHFAAGSAPSLQDYRDRFPHQKNDVDEIYQETIKELSKGGSTPEPEDLTRGHLKTVEENGRDSGSQDDSAEGDAEKIPVTPPQNTPDDQQEVTAEVSLDGELESNDDTMMLDSGTVDAPVSAPSDLEAVIPVYGDDKRYQVVSEIDRGGMGIVLKVQDVQLNRTLAMKVIRGQEFSDPNSNRAPSADRLARFMREASITSRLDHPGVVPVHELAKDDHGRLFFTMKMVQGKTLSRVAKEMRAKDSSRMRARILEVLVRVCDTLAFAHSHGVIHRDLKPANIMVGDYGEAYVMDWGLAKVIRGEHQTRETVENDQSIEDQVRSAGQTLDGSVMGTPNYMPPEQASGKLEELDERSDIYSLGALLYEVLTGTKPYAEHKNPVDVVMAVCSVPPLPINEVEKKAPIELVAIAEKAMAREKSERYASVTEIGNDIRAFLNNRVVAAYRTGFWAEAEKWIVRNRAVLATALLLLIGGLIVVAFQQFSYSSSMQLVNQELSDQSDELEEKNLRLKESLSAQKIARAKEQEANDRLWGRKLIQDATRILDDTGNSTLAGLLVVKAIDQYRYRTVESQSALYACLSRLNESQVFAEHGDDVTDARFSPDGKKVATCSRDGRCMIWEVATGELVTLISNHNHSQLNELCFSQDGKRILVSGHQGTVGIWDTETGERQILKFIRKNQITSLAFTANDSLFAVNDKQKILFFDSHSGEIAKQFALQESESEVSQFAVSPDQQYLAAGFFDGKVAIWKFETGELVSLLDAHGAESAQPPSMVAYVEFNSNSDLCVTSTKTRDNAPTSPAMVWEVATGKPVATLPSRNGVANAQFLKGTNLIVYCPAYGENHYIKIWDADQKTILASSEVLKHCPNWVKLSPDQSSLVAVSNSKDITYWRMETHHGKPSYIKRVDQLVGHDPALTVYKATFDPTGSRLLTCSGDRTARIWRLNHYKPIPALGAAYWNSNFRPDEYLRFAQNGTRMLLLDSRRDKGYLWSLPDFQLVNTLAVGTKLYDWRFIDEGREVVAVNWDGEVRCWDGEKGNLKHTYSNVGEIGYKQNIGFDPVSKTLCVSTKNKTLVWNHANHELLFEIPVAANEKHYVSPGATEVLIHDLQSKTITRVDLQTRARQEIFANSCRAIRYSPDGTYFYCYGEAIGDSTFSYQLNLLDPKTGTLQLAIEDDEYFTRFPRYTRISRDGKWIWIDYNVNLSDPETRPLASVWSVAEQKRVCTLGDPESILLGAADDLSRVIYRSNRRVALWDGRSGNLVATLQSTFGQFGPAKFSPDNNYFLIEEISNSSVSGTGLYETRVSLWDARNGQVVAELPSDSSKHLAGFLPSGEQFITCTARRETQVWPMNPLDVLEPRLSRQMTQTEIKFFMRDGLSEGEAQLGRVASLNQLQHRAKLIQPVTRDRILEAISIVKGCRSWLGEKPAPEDWEQVREITDPLFQGPFDTDPKLLEELAELESKADRGALSMRYLELAAQHPRSRIDPAMVIQAQVDLLPVVASCASVDSLGEYFRNHPQEYQEVCDWAQSNSEMISGYLKAKELVQDQQWQPAIELLESLLADSFSETEPVLLLAECFANQNQSESEYRILTQALGHGPCQSPEIWKRWLQVAFSKLSKTPAQLLKELPRRTERPTVEPIYYDHVVWLLKHLRQNQELRINAGGYEDLEVNGVSWSRDRFYTHGLGYYEQNGEARSYVEKPIKNTDSVPIYRTERWFNFRRTDASAGYEIPLPKGNYRIELGFVELFQDDRSFDVIIEGERKLQDYDPANGQHAVVDIHEFETSVEDGLLNIVLRTNNQSSPNVSSVRITPISVSESR